MTIPRSIVSLALNLLMLALVATWSLPAEGQCGLFRSRQRCQPQYMARAVCYPATYPAPVMGTPQAAYVPPSPALDRTVTPLAAPQRATTTPPVPAQPPGKVLPWGSATYPYNQSFTPAERAANQVTTDPYTASPPADRGVAATAKPAETAPHVAVVEQADPYGFVVWLNYQRAMRRLAPVRWDKTCEYHAYQNNLQQQSRNTIGHFHHVMRRQNAGAMGPGEPTWIAWIGSPGHADALFDPTITVVGLHVLGQYQTFNAN